MKTRAHHSHHPKPTPWQGTQRRGMEVGVSGSELEGDTSNYNVNPVDMVGHSDAEMKLALQRAHQMGANVIRSFLFDGKYSPWGRGNGSQAALENVEVYRVKKMIQMAKDLHYNFKFEVTLAFGRNVSTHDKSETQQATVHSQSQYAKYCKSVVEQLAPLGVSRYSIGNEVNYGGSYRAVPSPDVVPPNAATDTPQVRAFKNAARGFFADANSVEARAAGYHVPPEYQALAKKMGFGNFLPAYRQMFEAGYKAIHQTFNRIHPQKKGQCQVLLGEFLGQVANPKAFVKAMVNGSNKPLVADGMALHPYMDNTAPWKVQSKNAWDLGNLGDVQTTLANLAREGKLQNRHGKKLDLYLTEFGYSPDKWGPPLTEAQRAEYLHDAFERAQHAGAKQLLQYQVFQSPTASWNTGVDAPVSVDASGNVSGGEVGQSAKSIADWALHPARRHH